jgi:hypothetical protein
VFVKGYEDERFLALVNKGDVQIGGVDEVVQGARMASILMRASMQVQKLIKSEGDAFWVEATADGLARVTHSKLGEVLIGFIKLQIPDSPKFHTLYTLEPYIEMMAKYLKGFGLYQILSRKFLAESVEEATALMKHLNGCVDKIRQEAKSRKFMSKLNSYQRSSNKNYKELTQYIDEVFECHSRLLVLRVDLSYSKENSNTKQSEAARDLKHLFRNARSNKLFSDMVGYIWKLEYGPEKGFHYHMMFFFDGSKIREDGTLAKRIGRYWIDVVTKGRGLYYNCNAVKHTYKICGIGMINHADAELRENLRKAVIYLTKTDLYMKLQTEGRGMGKGNRPTPKDPRGRPRVERAVGE